MTTSAAKDSKLSGELLKARKLSMAGKTKLQPLKTDWPTSTDTINAIVGEARIVFTTDRHTITCRSTYFDKACSGKRKRAASSTPIEIPEDDADILCIYLHCVTKNEVDVGDLDVVLTGEEELSHIATKYLRLVKTWILADTLGDPITANMIIDEVIGHCYETSQLPGAPSIRVVATHEPREWCQSCLQKLFRDFYVHEAELDATQKLLGFVGRGDVPSDFLHDVVARKAGWEQWGPSRRVRDVFRPISRTSANACTINMTITPRPTRVVG